VNPGYSFDFSMVRLPVFDIDGFPVQRRGVTEFPGLYFMGLPWLHNATSELLHGTGQDAVHIAKMIADSSQPLVTSPASPAFVHYGSALGDPGLFAVDLS
jgi:hypothetical protein